MRRWLTVFLGSLGVMLGASLLWVWAAPLTGGVGRNVVFTDTNTVDIGGFLKGNIVTFHERATHPASPSLGDWNLYTLSAGAFLQSAAGVIIGPLGTGGGGGGGTPGGSPPQVQFNDGGVFAGDPDFTYNKTTKVLTVTGGVAGTLTPSQINANSGVLGTDSTGYATFDRLTKPHTHTALSPASTTTCGGFFTYVTGSGGNVDLTGQQLSDGIRDGQTCVIRNNTTNSVKYDNVPGDLITCGGASVIVVVGKSDLMIAWKEGDSEWEQFGCSDLNSAKAVGAEITTANSRANAFIVGDGTNKRLLYSLGGKAIDECEQAGAACNLEQIIPNGRVYNLSDHVGNTLLQITNPGQIPSGAFAPARSVCLPQLSNLTGADDNRLFGSAQIPLTVDKVWCHYENTTAPTVVAQFQLVGMTHASPTCVGPTAVATPQAVTAGGNVAAFVPIRFSVPNSPNPTTDTYELCVGYRGQ